MGDNSGNLTVSEAAKLLGVTPTTLRNWDKTGKLTPARDPNNGYRIYRLENVKQILRDNGSLYLPFAELTEAPEPIKTLDARALRRLIRQMSAAFRDSEGGGLLERFEEITKLIYLKLYDEHLLRTDSTHISVFACDQDDRSTCYHRLNRLYKQAVHRYERLALNGRGQLGEDKPAILRVVELLSSVTLSDSAADVKGVAYEELVRNTFEKTENQQFFTPRTVVSFMVDLMEASPEMMLCDPACGSGGFLIEALSKGIDPSKVVGIEVDKRMAWVAQMNLLIHGGEGAQVSYVNRDGSLGFGPLLKEIVPVGGFDAIITNPPFGSDFSNEEVLGQYCLGDGKGKRRRGVLFVERCIAWLKSGTGRLAIILDDSILNGSANEDVRRLILDRCVVEAVVSLPESTFKPYASVETSVLLLRKKVEGSEGFNPAVFMAKAERVGRKPNGDPLHRRLESGELVLDNDLEVILQAWRKHQAGLLLDETVREVAFICSAERFARELVQNNRLDVLFHHPSRDAAEEALARSPFPTPKLMDLVTLRRETAVPNAVDPYEIWRYVGLANIEAETGAYEVTEVFGDEVKSAVRRFEDGDVVFSKLRPELRKAFLAEEAEEAYVSGECYVLRPGMGPDRLDPRYLAFMLRSDIIFGQLVYQISGTGRPRVNKSAVLNLRIPLPPIGVQREIVAAQDRAHGQYLTHRQQSVEEMKRGREALARAEQLAFEKLCPVLS